MRDRLFSLCEDDKTVWEELLGIWFASANSAHVPSSQVLEAVATRFDEQSERFVQIREARHAPILT